MAATKIKGLQQWCRRMTDGYDHVDVSNFTTSWRDGMAFCALIHRFRPDLIDYESLVPENVFDNCKLAFEVAEQELDIPAFLEAEDMARLRAPDKLSVITYVSQYYNILSPLPQLGGPGVRSVVSHRTVSATKRSTDSTSQYSPATKRAPVMETKENAAPVMQKAVSASIGDICGICHRRVYLLERHMEGGKLYHRSCFRHSELSAVNKVYTRSPYLSPSLNSETQSFTYPSTNINPTSSLSGVDNGGKEMSHRGAAEIKTTPEASSLSKTSDLTGTKHLLDGPARESFKKVKLLSKDMDEEKYKKALVIKERLEKMKEKYFISKSADSDMMKEKYSISKSADSDKVLPLSGKEARKLEKKREEIVSSLKPVEELIKGTKRNMPIILQQTEMQTSGNSKTPISLSSSSSPTLGTKTGASKSDSVGLATAKTSNHLISTKLESQNAHSKSKHAAINNNSKLSEDKLDAGLLPKKNTLSNTPNAPTTNSAKSNLDSAESNKSSHPVAKPRVGAPRSGAKGSSEDDDVSTRPTLKTSVELRNKDKIPKPAPRRNMSDPVETIFVPHQVKFQEVRKSTLRSEPNIDEVEGRKLILRSEPNIDEVEGRKSILRSEPNIDELDTPRFFRTRELPPVPSSAPPPLPSSAPPPLPSSAPPPLPASCPIGKSSSLTGKDARKSPNEWLSHESKSPLQTNKHSHNKNSVSSGNKSHDLHSITDLHSKTSGNKFASHDKTQMKYTNKDHAENVSPHAFAKSQTTDGTEGSSRIRIALQPQDRRWSSPIPSEPNQTTTSAVPSNNENKDQTFIGLQTPLSVISSRRSSSPVPSDPTPPPILPRSASPSVDSAFKFSPAHCAINTEFNFTPPPRALNNETSPFSTSSLNVRSLEPRTTTSATMSTEETVVTDINMLRHGMLNTESSKPLDSSKNVMYSKETPRPRASSTSVINENNNAKFESKFVLNFIKDSEKTSEILDGKNIIEQNNLHPIPAKRRKSRDETKSASSMDDNALSSGKANLGISSADFKLIIPEMKVGDPAAASSSIDALKDDPMGGKSPQKPPRLFKMSKLSSHEHQSHSYQVDKSVEKNADDKLDPSVFKFEGFTSSSVLANEHQSETTIVEKTDPAIEVPQWKKDIEERKKKLREDIAKSESDTGKLKHLREKGLRKPPHISDIAQIEIASASQDISEKSSFPTSLENDSIDKSEIKNRYNNKSSLSSEENYNIHNVLEESEKRISTITSSGNQQEEENRKVKDKPEKDLPKILNINSHQTQNETVLNGSDFSQISNKTKEHTMQSGSSLENQTIDKYEKTANSLIKNKEVKLKDSQLEFAVSKTKLKTMEVNTDISSANKSELSVGDNSHDKQVGHVRAEDGKNLSKIKDVNVDLIQTNNKTTIHNISQSGWSHRSLDNNTNNKTAHSEPSPDISHIHKPKPKLVKPSDSDSSEEFQTNKHEHADNKHLSSESVHVSKTKHIQNLNINRDALLETIDLNNSDELQSYNEEGNRRISVSEEKLVLQTRNLDINGDQDKQPSPKVRRKITVLGKNNKKAAKSPPASPLPMKKIEVATKFNFEESSSDFESSLTESTSKLIIHDKKAAPPRPPPPRTPLPQTVPPLQISAIELQQQLLDIDSQLTDLELRGRDLEESIRNENTNDEDDEELINDWFRLVSERNELVRKEVDLVYISRQQDLEDEQQHIESQLRYLMSKSNEFKSPDEKKEEEYLIKRKMELVEQRSKIIDSMDEDRIRYETEDKDIKLMRERGIWKNSTGSPITVKDKRVSKSVFYS